MDANPAADRQPLAPILAINFTATLGFSIVVPFLVYLVTRLGGNGVVYGITGATYSLFQLVGAPVLGRWSDRWGRKPVLLLAQVGTALSWGLFLVALHLPVTTLYQANATWLGTFTITTPLLVIIVARAADGLTGANASVANAYMADITPERDRARNFGRLGMSANLGFVIGPALAGLLGATPWPEAAPVVAALSVSTLACLAIAFGLPPATPHPAAHVPARLANPALGQECKDCYDTDVGVPTSLSRVARLPGVPRLLTLNFLVFLAFNVFYVAFPVHLAHDLGWPLAATGVFFAALSLMMVVVQGPVLTALGRRWSERRLLLTGGAVLAGSFVFFGAGRATWLYAGAALLALGNGLMWPSLLALLANAAGEEMQGVVQGLAGSGAALASMVGLLVGGALFDRLGPTVFLLPTGVVLIATVLGARMRAPVPA